MTPIGIDVFFITKPLGLFQEDKVFPIGFLNFIILSIELIICVIFLLNEEYFDCQVLLFFRYLENHLIHLAERISD